MKTQKQRSKQAEVVSKRLLIAKDIMCALLIKYGIYNRFGGESENINVLIPEEAANIALRYTDELLRQEKELANENK